MGMSASQARLLSLTARLHDVEYKAQNIMSQKLALATQKDELYQNYCDALDATKIKAAFMNSNHKEVLMDANYSTLCEYNENRCVDYALVNNRSGKLIVSEEVKNAYDKYGHTDKYAFAMAMIGMEEGMSAIDDANILSQLGINNSVGFDFSICIDSECANGDDLYMTDIEKAAFDKHRNSSSELDNAYKNMIAETDDHKKVDLYQKFREVLYNVCGEDIYNSANTIVKNKENWNDIKGKFNYYANLWEAIENAGGCEAIDKEFQYGEAGNDWFNNMVNAGMVGIKYFDKTGNKEWTDTSVATSTNHNYLSEEQDDTDLKKAEAEYEHGLDLISQKDTKFDTELKKLETERSAITTEMESITKVRDENVERTFGIFS